MRAERRQSFLGTILLGMVLGLVAFLPLPASADREAGYGRIVSDNPSRSLPCPASRVLAAVDLVDARGAGVTGAPVIDADAEPSGGDPSANTTPGEGYDWLLPRELWTELASLSDQLHSLEREMRGAVLSCDREAFQAALAKLEAIRAGLRGISEKAVALETLGRQRIRELQARIDNLKARIAQTTDERSLGSSRDELARLEREQRALEAWVLNDRSLVPEGMREGLDASRAVEKLWRSLRRIETTALAFTGRCDGPDRPGTDEVFAAPDAAADKEAGGEAAGASGSGDASSPAGDTPLAATDHAEGPESPRLDEIWRTFVAASERVERAARLCDAAARDRALLDMQIERILMEGHLKGYAETEARLVANAGRPAEIQAARDGRLAAEDHLSRMAAIEREVPEISEPCPPVAMRIIRTVAFGSEGGAREFYFRNDTAGQLVIAILVLDDGEGRLSGRGTYAVEGSARKVGRAIPGVDDVDQADTFSGRASFPVAGQLVDGRVSLEAPGEPFEVVYEGTIDWGIVGNIQSYVVLPEFREISFDLASLIETPSFESSFDADWAPNELSFLDYHADITTEIELLDPQEARAAIERLQ